jgi:hypothetical protein
VSRFKPTDPFREVRDALDAMKPIDALREHRSLMDAMKPIDALREHRSLMDAMKPIDPLREHRSLMDAMKPIDALREHRSLMDAMKPIDALREHRSLADAVKPVGALRELRTLVDLLRPVDVYRELQTFLPRQRSTDSFTRLREAFGNLESFTPIADAADTVSLISSCVAFPLNASRVNRRDDAVGQEGELYAELRELSAAVSLLVAESHAGTITISRVLQILASHLSPPSNLSTPLFSTYFFPLLLALLPIVFPKIAEGLNFKSLTSASSNDQSDAASASCIASNIRSMQDLRMVTRNKVPVRAGWKKLSQRQAVLQEGDLVVVLERRGRYSLICYASRTGAGCGYGWVWSKMLKHLADH